MNDIENLQNGWVALWFYKFARVATQEQIAAFSKSSAREIQSLVEDGLIVEKMMTPNYKPVYILSPRGIVILKTIGIRVTPADFNEEDYLREVGISEVIVREAKFGWTVLTRDTFRTDIAPDIYIERQPGTSFFIHYFDDKTTRMEIVERVEVYGESEFVRQRDSYLSVYYATKPQDARERREVVRSALLDPRVHLDVFGGGKKVFMTPVDIEKILVVKDGAVVKGQDFVSGVEFAT